MIFGLFRRSSSHAVVRRLYATLVDVSRQPALYAVVGIPDTFEGRFESLTLHAALVLRRLQTSEAPGPALAQELVDTIFAHFDSTLREMGVGDTSVPKRMTQIAEAFFGRSAAYEEALSSDRATLTTTLARNTAAQDAKKLAEYVAASAVVLASQPLQDFIDGALSFAALAVEPIAVSGATS